MVARGYFALRHLINSIQTVSGITHSSPLCIISITVQIIPWRQTETNIPVSLNALYMPFKASALTARHRSVHVVSPA
jgi:hypothetical protein